MEDDQQHLRLWFQSVDVDNSNSVNVEELQIKLHPGYTVERVMMYDVDQNGAMSFEEFVSLHKFLNVVQFSFSNIARDQQILSLNEVYAVYHFPFVLFEAYNYQAFSACAALQQAGYSLDQPSFYTACQSFDPNRLGKFKLDDFISLCIFLQSAKNLFNAFDTSKQGRISLDYNQFIYCAANLRI